MSWLSPAVLDVECVGERVWIRPPQADDWEEWAHVRSTSRAFLEPWEPTWPADSLTRSTWHRRLARQYHDWKNDSSYAFLAFRANDNALVGGLNLTYVRRGIAQMAMLGYWVGQPYARQGYTSAAVKLLCDYGFNTLNLHRIEAGCLPRNAASRALLAKVGFMEEGIARHYLKIQGVWEDHVMYGKVADSPNN